MNFATLTIYLIVVCFTTVLAQRTFLDNFAFKGRISRILLDQFADQVRSKPHLRNLQIKKVQAIVDESVPFPCNTQNVRSNEKPISVHNLRPGDIDVVGALGDSLTAGYGALSTSVLDLMREYRGVSFPIGGEKTWRQYLTLPNILKNYNPNLVGYSLRASNSFERASQFNAAEVSSISSDIPYMTKVLLKRITSDKRINLKKDWKLISIFVGANDFCQFCYEKSLEDILMNHERDLVRALRLLRDNLPRTFVVLINPPFVNLLYNFTNLTPSCQVTQRVACPCIIGDTHALDRLTVDGLIRRWHKLDEEIANYKEFEKEDFTVVNQPILQEPALPRKPNGDVDEDYFAADCFHFSQKGHALLANALWNSILSPVDEKQKTIFSMGMKCPSPEFPYLFTRKNSNTVVIK